MSWEKRLKGESVLQEGLWETEPPAGEAVQSAVSRAKRQRPGCRPVVSVEAGVAEEATEADEDPKAS